MLRLFLDRLYTVSGYLAGIFLLALTVLIVGQIVGRFLHIAFDATELSGFCLAAMTYFGLAYTFRRGSHIRVDLLIRHLRGQARRLVEIWACGSGFVLLCYFSYYAVSMAFRSYVFGDLSTSLIAIPLWIPQLGMAIGSVVLTIAFLEELIEVIRGSVPSYLRNSDTEFSPIEDSSAAPDQAFGVRTSGPSD